MKERLIYPPRCVTFNPPHSDGNTPVEIEYDLYTETVATKKVGDFVVCYAGAPGTGRTVERITRIDATGVYGVLIENTIRELDPEEVR